MATPVPNLIGASPVFLAVLDDIARLAQFDAPVLITGETGTGKELAARGVHYLSARRGGPFVPINCGALPDTLIESELFGYERGAFTDARQRKEGLVSAAQGGTLFLDEIDSLAPRGQAALLRFLQDQRFRPVGAASEQHANVRIVAASSPRLAALIERGDFRADLAFRLDVLSVRMPPLRERTGDVPLLISHFTRRYAQRYDLPARLPHPASVRWANDHSWPGNVRELDNLVHRQLLLCQGELLQLAPHHAPEPTHYSPRGLFNAAREAAINAWEREYLIQLLREAGGNVTQAACLAGKERRCLGKLLKKHGVTRELLSGS